jgi:uncharacterized protein
MPMFPLGSVAFPGVALPLRVFEPRYLDMLQTVLASDEPEFGVVLIERGSEVGGGEVRRDIGCVVRVVQAAPIGAAWSVISVGVRRMRVRRWLDDDPYPLCEAVEWPDSDGGDDLADRLAAVELSLWTCRELAAQLGELVGPITSTLSRDAVMASYQAAALAPLGPADHDDLLRAEGPDQRLDLLADLLAEQSMVLTARLDVPPA